MRGIAHLGGDKQPVLVAHLGEEFQSVFAQSAEGVGGGAGLVAACTQDANAQTDQHLAGLLYLLAALYGTGSGNHQLVALVAPDVGVADANAVSVRVIGTRGELHIRRHSPPRCGNALQGGWQGLHGAVGEQHMRIGAAQIEGFYRVREFACTLFAEGDGQVDNHGLAEINDMVNGDDADDFGALGRLGDRQCGDVELVHHGECVGEQSILADVLVGGRHDVGGGDVQVVVLLYGTTEVAIGDDTDAMPLVVGEAVIDHGHAEVLVAHLADEFAERRGECHAGYAGAHAVLDAPEQFASECSARVIDGEVLCAEVALLHEADHECVAHKKGGSGGCGGGKSEGACLVVHVDGEGIVGTRCERRLQVARDGNDTAADAVDGVDDIENLVGLTAVADEHRHIIGGNHTEVAVHGFGSIDEDRRGACGGERRCHLMPDDARLADAHDHYLALAGVEDTDYLVESMVNRRGKALEFAYLLGEYLLGSV